MIYNHPNSVPRLLNLQRIQSRRCFCIWKERIIIKYSRKKYHHGAKSAKRIVADHPEFCWNVKTMKPLLKNMNETDSAERKPGSGRLRSVLAADNIEDIGDMILNQDDQSDTHKTPTEIANEISRWNRIIDEDLQLCPLKKTKVEN